MSLARLVLRLIGIDNKPPQDIRTHLNNVYSRIEPLTVETATKLGYLDTYVNLIAMYEEQHYDMDLYNNILKVYYGNPGKRTTAIYLK